MRPSLFLLEELKQWLNVATPPARNIVRKIFSESSEPLHTHEIFLRSQRDFPLAPQEEAEQQLKYARLVRRIGPRQPPNPIHHIRSVKYLKTVVLPDLVERDEIVKVHRTRPSTLEEREIAASLKPLTRSQRKKRGAVGSGKRPQHLTGDGNISEWVWRLKTAEDFEREAELERRDKERAEKQREKARLNCPPKGRKKQQH